MGNRRQSHRAPLLGIEEIEGRKKRVPRGKVVVF